MWRIAMPLIDVLSPELHHANGTSQKATMQVPSMSSALVANEEDKVRAMGDGRGRVRCGD